MLSYLFTACTIFATSTHPPMGECDGYKYYLLVQREKFFKISSSTYGPFGPT